MKVTCKDDPSISYLVSKVYSIPKFYDDFPYQNQIAIEAFPPIVTTLFSQLKITISDLELKSYEYLRLRAIRPLGDSDLLIDRSKNYTFHMYLPKDTIEVKLDIISKKRLNSGNYDIYSVKVPGLYI
jgi:hypothetical protein